MDDQGNSTGYLLSRLKNSQLSLSKMIRFLQQAAHSMSSENFVLLLSAIVSFNLLEQAGAKPVFSHLYFGLNGTDYELELDPNHSGYDSVLEQLSNGACGTYVISAQTVNENFHLLTQFGNVANFYRATGHAAIQEVEHCVLQIMHDAFDGYTKNLEDIRLSGNLWWYVVGGLVGIIVLSRLFAFCLTMLERIRVMIVERCQTVEKVSDNSQLEMGNMSKSLDEDALISQAEDFNRQSCNINSQPAVIYKKF